MKRFEIVHTEGAEQPWHVRLVAANDEIVWWTEKYADRRDTLRAIGLLAETMTLDGDGLVALAGTGDIPIIEVESDD
jgi:uncharacterized protein YegP (UPF0339 family)